MSVRDFWQTRSELDYAQAAYISSLKGSSSPRALEFSTSSASTAAAAGYAPLTEINLQASSEFRFGSAVQLSDAIAAGEAFLAGGASPAGTPGVTFFQCFGSGDCGSGFACVGNECVPDLDAIDGQGGGGDCGYDNGSNQPCTRGRTGQSGTGCLITTAGDCGAQQDECCGKSRCCSFSGAGVFCKCGECPESQCRSTCDRYSKANGTDKAGCDGKSCSECASCEGGICVRRGGAACYCDGRGCADCNVCGEDGSCTVPTDAAGNTNCLGCVECSKCGKTNNHCSRLSNMTTAEKMAQCLRGISCPDGSDGSGSECIGECETITVQNGGAEPACPPGYKCRQSGSGTVGSESFALYEQCDMSGVPESCKDCDCNCHNDCPECKLCGADGTCYDDPACAANGRTTWFKADVTYEYTGCNYNPNTGSGGCTTNTQTGTGGGINVTTPCAPLPHSLVLISPPTATPYGPCETGTQNTSWKIVDGNGTTIVSSITSGGVSGTWCGGNQTAYVPPALTGTQTCP